MTTVPDKKVVILGGGPAGLTAAYELAKLGRTSVVIEKQDKVGGIARTETYKGFRFDMGGHRFFTKSAQVKAIWADILKTDFIRRPRLSRIYYKKKFFNYPLKPLNAMLGLGLVESILIVFSYLRWRVFPYRQEHTFEQWVTNRFGKRLFETFFKSYTEKVWGIPCSELKAEWAAQRIKDLSLKTALLNMFFSSKNQIRTLIDEFDYPRLGPGMMWNAVKNKIEQEGSTVRLNTDVVKICRRDNRIEGVILANNGQAELLAGTHFISSMPVTELVKKIDPPPPTAVLQAAEQLHYRDFLTVCLIVNRRELFPDNWIYIHDPEVKVGRIQNFKNWSADMVPDQAATSLGLEYFCKEGDELWNTPDADLIELAKREIERVGLASAQDVTDGCVVRVPKAYPVYDAEYADHLATLKNYVQSLENIQTVGRNGLHRYNNQDHAMLTGMFAVRNLVSGERNDLWAVNTDQEYHEEVHSDAGVGVPDITTELQGVVARAFPKLDAVALGLALGTVFGGLLFLATQMLVLKGGEVIGPNLLLLSRFFPGYSVTATGSVLGLVYGFGAGYLGGWAGAFLRNAGVFLYMAFTQRRAERQILRKLLEHF